MSSNAWVRLWHDMPTDPKWRVIARRAGQRIGDVIAVFNFVMVNASANANERGRTQNLFADDIAAALDMEEADISAILDAMKGKVLCKDGYLLGWEKRQPKREDSSAERAKKWREERKRTQANATERPDTDTDTDKNISTNVDTGSADPDAVRPEHVFEVYQDLAKSLGLAVPRDLTPERRQLVRGRIAQYSLDDFLLVFDKCRASPFLRGDRQGRTPLSFDWLMKKGNFQKTLEGNYDG